MAGIETAKVDDLDVAQLCGQLIVGGFASYELPETYVEALERGYRAGAILFKRNLTSLEQVVALNRSIIETARPKLPPFIGVDQEGGRVVRLPPPFTKLPPMRRLGAIDDVALTQAAAAQVGRELAAVGFNLDFAPVMDVDSNPDNPVIGDRAFGGDPRRVAKHGVAFVQGLQQSRVLACAKHFPGHGDTSLDSHLELPVVDRAAERLERVELPPFRAASGAGVAAMMSAHVVYTALDPDTPATFSLAIMDRLLRRAIGFEGVLFSDDLEMGAVSRSLPIERAAVDAVWAGCDVLLICKDWSAQESAHAALVERAEADDAFAARCREAVSRSLAVRGLCAATQQDEASIRAAVDSGAGQQMLERIEARSMAMAETERNAPPDSRKRLTGDDEP